ncbi:histidine kinase [Micromonospora musae]|uniref:histidine kinase n=1 Tax=Micromonospora musae TaxID=1894970 RepID=A0ABX9RC28_9ACTN|nr:sensor histidine kinase [Micromonospora musae]RKN21137.1 histidine kinase [Micromonospora musae]
MDRALRIDPAGRRLWSPRTPTGPRPELRRRTARDWFVDAVLFGIAVAHWAWTWHTTPLHHVDGIPGWMHTIDPWVGAVACLSLWWRRRYPVALGIAMFVVLMLAATGLGAALVVVLTVAVYRNWLPATLITGIQLLPSLAFGYENPPPGVTRWAYVTLICLMYLVPLGWGIAVRARRQLIANLRREVDRERRDQQQRLDGARRAERERIAREMHDVLAHRISLISVHAGALAYRTAQADAGAGAALNAAEVGGAIEVIRDNARQALTELGDVLAVLRTGAEDDTEPESGDLHQDGRRPSPDEGRAQPTGRNAPQPRLADLGRLVSEAQAAGQRVRFEFVCAPGAAESLQPALQRTVYRTVQEGLTNARKHAGQAEVAVRVEVTPATGIVATVSNPLPPESTAATIPGAGAGLTGLAERLAIDGGVIEHGVTDGTFRLTTRLPWPL